ncbi:penicillin-binding transpeptidase domain-containing protein [Spongiactinospora sp. TRM90649]|uniref:penicillin-binding transpeptidase domain-containing protein n=1 Tax=Spongiactinospora sp. TRM90649 TaxID=3031114 RepID=UPI0023F90B13|nr:penicillin-binding transpeptidase domain-containing protein [Spongiactinospora sp. TRM90649]MDF5758027.1 penicillin-binding transpeptidase domain-containing protein [Spongiactinospora sp. TRM90649]
MPRRRTIAIVSVTAVLLAGAAAGGGYYLLRTRGTPAETAQRFTQAWQRGDLTAMRAELTGPVPGFSQAYDRLDDALGPRSTMVKVTGVREDDQGATAGYSVVHDFRSGGRWAYDGSLRLVVSERRWKVRWTQAAVHPDLAPGRRIELRSRWPARAELTDAGGERIDDGDDGGSVAQLTGALGKATAKDVTALGGAYRVGDIVGKSGLQATFQRRLAGVPATDVQLLGAGGEPIKPLGGLPGEDGEPLRTTLDLTVQKAAADAIRKIEKPAALVAVRPSTGEILAVANNSPFNRALEGSYAPGSTFKAVTAIGLLASGMTPGEQVTCPKDANVGGLAIRNSDHAEYGALSFADSFAHSCNTTFAPLAAERLGADKLLETAEAVGFNQPLDIGVPAVKSSLPKAADAADLAAESFGQGRITASPLVMASVAAAIADGTWRPPTLVGSIQQRVPPKEFPEGVAGPLRQMMLDVVTKGTAKDAGLPDGTRGKTGTAEFGTADPPETHAWFIGFRGDIAMSVIVEGGGGGGKVAAPVAADFLRAME